LGVSDRLPGGGDAGAVARHVDLQSPLLHFSILLLEGKSLVHILSLQLIELLLDKLGLFSLDTLFLLSLPFQLLGLFSLDSLLLRSLFS
jgi:hypothetical protein